jgi:hypothetical protein
MATTDDTQGKLARVYDQATDTWFPLLGLAQPHTHTADGLSDVAITSVANNDILSYSSSASAFVNTASATLTSAMITDATITNITSSGLISATELTEVVVDATISSGSLTANFTDGNIFYISASPTANFTINATNVPTTNNRTITMTFIVKQGSTGYIPSVFAIAGTSQTLRWVGGSPPTPTSTANDIDIFNFTLLRLSSTWTVLANSTLDI